MDVQAIVLANVPVLCIDTCSILDVYRDPTRETVKPNDAQSALDLVAATASGNLICLMAEQVEIEFNAHDQSIQKEAEMNLKIVQNKIERINKIVEIFGTITKVDLTHLDNHVAQARKIVDIWFLHFKKVTPSPHIHQQAFERMNACIAPAKRGKDSAKDCLIYETYLEAIKKLRDAGLTTTIVFLSSNTADYLNETRILKPEIVSEFNNLNIKYTPNMSAAKHSLGI